MLFTFLRVCWSQKLVRSLNFSPVILEHVLIMLYKLFLLKGKDPIECGGYHPISLCFVM